VNPRSLNNLASYDAASNMCKASAPGGGERTERPKRPPLLKRDRDTARAAAAAGAGHLSEVLSGRYRSPLHRMAFQVK
jgi:hypothetical protein